MTEKTTRDEHLDKLAQHKLLTHEQTLKLIVAIREGDKKAEDTLVKHNVRLVMKIADKYHNRGVPFSDLVSEGLIGLCVAMKRYDPAHGTKFSTYATYWIRQKIGRAITDQSSLIRLPIHIHLLADQIKRARAEIVADTGKQPTTDELADYLDVPKFRIIRNERAMKLATVKTFDVVDNPRFDDAEKGEYDRLDAEPTISVEDAVTNAILEDEIRQLFDDTLNAQEEIVMSHCFGLNGYDAVPMTEIAQKMDLTRERIGQVMAYGAYPKLRQSEIRQRLEDYL